MKIALYEPWFGKEEEEAIIKTMRSKWWAMGPKVQEFEEAICERIGCKYAVAYNSATSGFLGLFNYYSADKFPEFSMPSLTFSSVAHGLKQTNHSIKFLDIEKDTLTPIHGTDNTITMDYAGIPNLKIDHNLKDRVWLIDAAHSIGAIGDLGPVGSYGNATVFSFHAVKNVSTGCGGMVVTDNSDLAEFLKLFRYYGFNRPTYDRHVSKEKFWEYTSDIIGGNYYLNDLLASIGLEQFKKLDTILERRQEIYNEYVKRLHNRIPYLKHPKGSALHLFTIQVDNRDNVMHYLKENGIGCGVHYPPIHLMKPYKGTTLKITETVVQNLISLPMHTGLTLKEVNYICDKLLEGIENV